MFALFGQFGGDNFNLFDSLKTAFQGIDNNLNVVKSTSLNCYIAIGQSLDQNFFPYDGPFINKSINRFYALQGYLWTQAVFPKDNQSAQKSIKEIGDFLLDRGELILSDESGGMFVLVAADLNEQELRITSNYLGVIPLYYTFLGRDSALFSTHIRPLAKVISADVDEVGIIHHNTFHNTIGPRTLYKRISRLNSGETMLFNCGSGKLTFKQASGYYSNIDAYKSDEETSDALWADYISGLIPVSQIDGIKGIMLSGGFDTRLVVSGFHCQGNRQAAFTLGDADNFEVEIAQKVSKLIKAEQGIHVPLEEHNLVNKDIDQLVNQVEFVNFPYCITGACALQEMGAVSASTGFGGESFLGGQAYTLLGSDVSFRNRFKMALQRSLGSNIQFSKSLYKENLEKTVQLTHNYFDRMLERRKHFFTQAYGEQLNNARQELNSDIDNEITRLLINQPNTMQQLVERFWIEHHVLKHFGRQELTLMAIIPVILPTIHHTFLRRCTNLDPNRKLDHGIYLKLVRRYLGDLARLPTSNIPINLTKPDFLLWLSRAMRARSDQRFMSNMIKRKGRISGYRFAWSNFEQWLRQNSFFDNLPGFISFDVYSKEYLEQKISRIKNWQERVYSGQDFLTMVTISEVTKPL